MFPTEEDNYELLKIQLRRKVSEWDLYIYKLKKSAPVKDADLEDMWNKRLEAKKDIESIQNSLPESSTTLSKRRPFKLMLRKLWNDYNDIYENYTEEGDSLENWLENHSDSKGLETAQTSPDEQLPSPVIAKAEAIATKSKRKRKKKHQKHLLKLTPRPRKLNKATMMKILLRRRMIIPNRVKNLLDPARRPQCHPFPLKGRMKPVYTCTPQQTTGSVHNRQLPSRHPQSMSGSYRQSTARSSRLNTNKAGEAVLVYPNALYNEGHYYNSFPNVEDPYIAESPKDIAVKFESQIQVQL